MDVINLDGHKKFIPGPWIINKWEDGFLIEIEIGPENKDYICRLTEPSEIIEEIEGNANLIAVAPELLKDVEFAYGFIKAMETTLIDSGVNHKEFSERLEKMRVTIYKAHGIEELL